MAKKGKHRPQRSGTGGRGQLIQAEKLLDARKWDEARDLLLDVTAQHPNNRDAWAMLSEALTELKDYRPMWWATQNLLRLEPHAEENWFNAVSVAFTNMMPFTALEYCHEFLRRFPGSFYTAEIRETQATLEAATDDIRRSPFTAAGSTNEDFCELEQANFALESGKTDLAEKLARSTLARSPQLLAPRNNLCLILAMKGDLDGAIQQAQQVLERDANNIHALSNLVQFHMRKGQPAAAQPFAERLLQQTAHEETLPKVVEGLAYLGDYPAIVRLFEQTKMKPSDGPEDPQLAMLYHLAGVAYAHQGNDKRAKQLWQQALKVTPDYDIAQDNLDNLKQPVGERVRAFPFSLAQWVPTGWFEELAKSLGTGHLSESALKARIEKFLQLRPELAALLPILMERGDAEARETVRQIGEAAQLPILAEFALSEHGTDSERMQAAQRATELGMLPRGKPVPLYIKGQRTELQLLGYEITSEPDSRRIPGSTQRLIESIHEMLTDERYVEAERAARAATAKVPGEQTLWNYLMVSLQAQGKIEEADALTLEIAERFPNYSFAQISLARLYTRQGKLDQARQLIEPMTNRSSFHTSEFTAFCAAQIELMLAENNKDAAQSWLQMWEQVVPDNPNLGHYRSEIRRRR